MAAEQIPLMFFKPQPGADPLVVARSLRGAMPSTGVVSLDPEGILRAVRATRGFGRLKVALPAFSFDNPRTGAAFEGTAGPTHIEVRFFGDFEKVAGPLFVALTSQGLACYSVWDEAILTESPKWEEPTVDGGFAARMARVVERRTLALRETEPDAKRRAQVMGAYVNSPEFRAEMAAEARREKPGRGNKAYDDVVNCFVRWKDGRASAAELGPVRKLDPKYAAMSLAELKALVGDSPRLLLATAVSVRQAKALCANAERLGVATEVEPP